MEVAVILVEPEYPINLGSIARVMKNFGVDELILVNPKARPEDELARKFAVHAVDILENAKITKSLDEALGMVNFAVGTSGVGGKDYIPERTPITPEEFARRIFLTGGKVGIVFGRESRGLDNDELEKLDFTVTIPTSGAYPIMNLSHAVAVILYEVYKQRIKTEEVERPKPAGRLEREVFIQQWRELMNVLNTPKDPYRKKYTEIMMRRVLGRAFIYEKEIYAIIGPLRRAVRSLKKCKEKGCLYD